MAAIKLGLESVPVIRLSHMSETQRRAYILADNKLAELGGGWDEEMLEIELTDLASLDFDVSEIGFEEPDLSEINFQPGTEADQGKLDQLEPKNVKCPHCGKTFDAREQM